MNVCIFQPVIPHYRTSFFNALGRAEGIDLTVAASRTLDGVPDSDRPDNFLDFQWHDAPVRQLGPLYSQPEQVWLRHRKRFDVVVLGWNARYIETNYEMLRPPRAMPRPRIVLWGHGTSPLETRLRRRYRDYMGSRADAVVVYADANGQQLLSRGFRPEQLYVAPNALDQRPIVVATNYWLKDEGAQLGFRRYHRLEGKRLLLFVARLTAGKRVDLLLAAFAQLLTRRSDVVLAIIGSGELDAVARQWAEGLGVLQSVRFLGTLHRETDLAPWFLTADAAVIPSAVGLSILHAFSYGLPLITSSDAAAHGPEFAAMQEGVNGLLFRAGDVFHLARQMELLLHDQRQQAALSAGALQTARTGAFTMSNMVSGMRAAILGL